MGLRVITVDDSAFMRNMLKKLVVDAGAEVVGEAGDGAQAVDVYKKEKPDLVFMDIVMPKRTGLEALKDIKKLDSKARIIMCSSVGQDKIIAEAVDAGATDFIVKPFKAQDIKAVLKKCS